MININLLSVKHGNLDNYIGKSVLVIGSESLEFVKKLTIDIVYTTSINDVSNLMLCTDILSNNGNINFNNHKESDTILFWSHEKSNSLLIPNIMQKIKQSVTILNDDKLQWIVDDEYFRNFDTIVIAGEVKEYDMFQNLGKVLNKSNGIMKQIISSFGKQKNGWLMIHDSKFMFIEKTDNDSIERTMKISTNGIQWFVNGIEQEL